jgi:hypothetical protein
LPIFASCDRSSAAEARQSETRRAPVGHRTSTTATDTIDYVATDSQGLSSTSTRMVIVGRCLHHGGNLNGSVNPAAEAQAQADNESSNFGTIYGTYARHTLWCLRSLSPEQNTGHAPYPAGSSTLHEDVWNITYFHRAIQKRIGETLSAGYDLSTP